MKYVRDRRFKISSFVFRTLIIGLVLIGLVLISGTIYGMFFRGDLSEHKQAETSWEGGQGQTFTGIGRLRIPTKVSAVNSPPGMVILLVTFIYHPEDKAFFEELVLKIRDFREIITGYIGSLSVTELQNMDDESIKTELLHRFNAILRLGQIEILYFSDFMVIE